MTTNYDALHVLEKDNHLIGVTKVPLTTEIDRFYIRVKQRMSKV